MYNCVGKKIQVLAQVLGWIYLITGIIGFFILVAQTEFWSALASLGGGILFYFLTWGLYGFGQLIDDTHAIRDRLAIPNKETSKEDNNISSNKEAIPELPEI